MNDKERTLFALEDDRFLGADIKEMAEEAGWKVISTRCVDEALREASAIEAGDIDLWLIDMMAPVSCEHLKLLDGHLKLRDKAVRRRNESRSFFEFSEAELLDARQELIGIDQSIQPCVNLEAGLKLIEKLTAVDKVDNPSRMYVFSARSVTDEVLAALRKMLNDPEWKCWWQKPIDPDRLMQLFVNSS